MLGGYTSSGTIADVERVLANGGSADQARAAFGPQWSPGVIQSTANQQQGNIDAWWQDYQNRGGARGQAEGILSDPRYSQGLTSAWNQASMIPQYQAEYAKARGEAYGQLDFIKDRQSTLSDRYAAGKQEVRDTYDIEGLEADRADLREQFVHQTGGRQVLGAVQGDVMAREQALSDLASQKGTMSPMQYAQAQKAINDQYNQAIVTKTGAEYDRVNQAWLNSEAKFADTVSQARSSLATNLANLTIGEGAEAIGLAGAGSNLMTGILNSINGETSFINNATQSALEASQFAAGMLWQAVGADESARKFAMVDAPNQILENSRTLTMQVESQYLDSVFRTQQQSDLFAQLGLGFQFNFSPTIANMADYLTPMVEGAQNWSAYQMGQQQMEMARNAQSQQNALGWINAGTNMFDFKVGPKGTSWGIG
jgi:hypothetical protein